MLSTLTSIHPPELIAQWESMDDVPQLVNGKVYSVYEAQFQNGELFHVYIYLSSDIVQLCQLDFKHISSWWKQNVSLVSQAGIKTPY